MWMCVCVCGGGVQSAVQEAFDDVIQYFFSLHVNTPLSFSSAPY